MGQNQTTVRWRRAIGGRERDLKLDFESKALYFVPGTREKKNLLTIFFLFKKRSLQRRQKKHIMLALVFYFYFFFFLSVNRF